jgi:8-oxo-dGTP pyrophosphatase MutT (NUDIX family)
MEIPQPGPGEELGRGEATVPRPAATVIILRGGAHSLEVLLVKRNPEARFMGGAWVFPGGAVDRREGEGQEALRAAALRELHEEAGIAGVGPDELILFSRWITPAQVKIRFDTWFYLAALPAGAQPRVDGREVVEARWYEPAQALEAARSGELLLVFPTIKMLQTLSRFASPEEALEVIASLTVEPILPRVDTSGPEPRILLPGDPGY